MAAGTNCEKLSVSDSGPKLASRSAISALAKKKTSARSPLNTGKEWLPANGYMRLNGLGACCSRKDSVICLINRTKIETRKNSADQLVFRCDLIPQPCTSRRDALSAEVLPKTRSQCWM